MRLYPLLLVALAANSLAACATSVMDDPGGLLPQSNTDSGGMTDSGMPPPPGHDAAMPSHDSAGPVDSGSAVDSTVPGFDSSPPADTGMGFDTSGFDAAAFDVNVMDVSIPDVSVPDGSVACDYLGNGGSNLAQYLAECIAFSSFATPCSGGCGPSTCCATLCTKNNHTLCLPK
jgi:hypothetical protein